MNHHERAAADRLERYVAEDERDDTCCNEIRTLLAALRRWDRLASDGLNERSIDFLNRYQSARVPGVPSDAGEFLEIVERLQAQLTAAKDAVTVAEGIASDALEDRGLPRLEEVRRETAEQCVKVALGMDWSSRPSEVASKIKERLGLTAPADPQPVRAAETICRRCRGAGSYRVDEQGEYGRNIYSDTCRDCNGTGLAPADPQPDERQR